MAGLGSKSSRLKKGRLFERPMRVGDVVTVGDKDGTVTRIRLRATTIRDWDGKELLVPNREFINVRVLRQDGPGEESYWERHRIAYEHDMNVISVLQKIASPSQAQGRNDRCPFYGFN